MAAFAANSVLCRLALRQGALVQLSVPVIAATGGVVLLAEALTVRLAVSSVVVLGSIALGITGRRARPGLRVTNNRGGDWGRKR